MFDKLLTLLRSPYPLLMKRWKSVLIPSCIVFFILSMFQPFGISQMGEHKMWVLLGYAVVSALALSVTIYVFPTLFPRYHREKNWTFGKELLATFSACLLIAIGNWLYTSYIFGWYILSWDGFWLSLIWVAILAPIPIVFFMMWDRNLQLSRNLKEAMELNLVLSKRNQTKEEVKKAEADEKADGSEVEGGESCYLVFSGGAKDVMKVDADTLLYIEAEGNYICITYRNVGKLQQKLLRGTMKQAEEATAACPYILRCHRAFLVNVRAVVKVDGNSQGYRLRLEDCKEEVPVSRGYAKEVKRLIERESEG